MGSILPALRQQPPSSSTKPPSMGMGSRLPDKEAAEHRTGISRSKVPSHWSGLRMNTASPTILRTRHKFGDYLSQPDLAKFELPKKMSRPWIVNNAFEQEKLKDLIVTERPVEASLVMRQIKESKQERKKQPGYNKRHVRNINDIIEKDQKTVKEIKKKQSTKDHVEKKRKHMLKKPLLSGRPVHDHGADGAGDGGQPPDRRLLRRPPAGSTSARARCPAPACLPPTEVGLPLLLLVLLLVHLLLHLSSRLRRRLCRRVGLGERVRQLGGDGGRHQVE